MCYNIVSVLCFVFLATGQWDQSSPSVLGGEVLTTGLPGKSQTMWSFTLLLTWRTTYTFKCKVLGSSQHSGHASLGKLSFPHFLKWFSRDTAKGFPGDPVVKACLQLTTSSILNLCRSAFCFSGCSVPCHFCPFLCLSVEGCFMLKGFFMLHLLLTFPPNPLSLRNCIFPAERNTTSLSKTPMFLNPTQTSFWVLSIQVLTRHFHSDGSKPP